VPLPAPEAPEVIVMKLLLLVAVHAQLDAVVTVTLPVVAPAPTEWVGGEIEYVQAVLCTVL